MWASDDSLAYVFIRSSGIRVLDMEKGVRLDDLGSDYRIVDVYDVGGDVMAIYTANNTVAFYNMLTAELIMESEPFMGDLKSVTYNPRAEIAVVATSAELGLFDLVAGVRAYGPILHAVDYKPEEGLAVYITNNAEHLVYLKSSTPAVDEYGDEVSRYYDSLIVPLYTSERLLELAAEFE